MKLRILRIIITFALLAFYGHSQASKAQAANCTSIPVSGNYTVNETCTFPGTPYDGLDAGTGTTNTAILTIGASGSLSILNGQTLLLGSVTSNTGGSITVIDGGAFRLPGPIYVTDADGDGYPVASSQSSSGTTRRDTMTAIYTTDCGDGNANAKPGQTTYYSTTFTNTATGLSYDWNCDGTETKQYPTATYTCTACTNGSGYASTINSTAGYAASPACGVAGTWYTISNATCRDPAVSACSGSYTTSSVAQPCR